MSITQLITTRARLQQLESTYERTDRERLEAVLTSRQLYEQVSLLEERLAEEQEKVSGLDLELAQASSAAMTLQSTVNRLRGKIRVDNK